MNEKINKIEGIACRFEECSRSENLVGVVTLAIDNSFSSN